MVTEGRRKQLMVLTLTRLAIGHEAVSSRTETPVAPWCVHTLVLTGIPHLTLIDVCWCCTQRADARKATKHTENMNREQN